MKWNFVHLGITAVAVTSFSPCFANSTQIVYGLEHATKFNHQTQHNLYIQAGSFVEQTKAKQYQRVLRSKTKYPVKVSYHAKTYGCRSFRTTKIRI